MTSSHDPALILNVDDDEASLYARSRILSAAGYRVCSASSGRTALDMVGFHHPDLVLLDVHLPDIDGVEVCRRLKSGYASTIVIQISATSVANPQATVSLNSGADAYLSEPVDPDVLVATIRAMMRLRKSERDLATANESLATLNRQLMQSNEDLEQFAFLASHDLQEPLRTITTYVQLIMEELAGRFSEVEQQYFESVLAGARRMRHLIEALLVYSQVREFATRSEVVDLKAVSAAAVESLHESIQATGATLHMPQTMPAVYGDSPQLTRVMQNLLSNTLKYAQPGEPPVVNVSAAEAPDGMCEIRVRDNGRGISPRYHDLIFAPFKRLHGAEIPGAGIGLAVCRRIVEGHGGKITVESKEGAGATFLFTLPTLVCPLPRQF